MIDLLRSTTPRARAAIPATIAAAWGFCVVLASSGCVYYTSDPRVGAAENFRNTVFDLIGKDEDQTKRLNGLHLGMTDQQVIAAAGAPSRRETRTTSSGRKIETWLYNGELSMLGTLTFENGALAQISTSGTQPSPTPTADD